MTSEDRRIVNEPHRKKVVEISQVIERCFGRRLQIADIAAYFGDLSEQTVGAWLTERRRPARAIHIARIERLWTAMCAQPEIHLPASFNDVEADRQVMNVWHETEEALAAEIAEQEAERAKQLSIEDSASGVERILLAIGKVEARIAALEERLVAVAGPEAFAA